MFACLFTGSVSSTHVENQCLHFCRDTYGLFRSVFFRHSFSPCCMWVRCSIYFPIPLALEWLGHNHRYFILLSRSTAQASHSPQANIRLCQSFLEFDWPCWFIHLTAFHCRRCIILFSSIVRFAGRVRLLIRSAIPAQCGSGRVPNFLDSIRPLFSLAFPLAINGRGILHLGGPFCFLICLSRGHGYDCRQRCTTSCARWHSSFPFLLLFHLLTNSCVGGGWKGQCNGQWPRYGWLQRCDTSGWWTSQRSWWSQGGTEAARWWCLFGKKCISFIQ